MERDGKGGGSPLAEAERFVSTIYSDLLTCRTPLEGKQCQEKDWPAAFRFRLAPCHGHYAGVFSTLWPAQIHRE